IRRNAVRMFSRKRTAYDGGRSGLAETRSSMLHGRSPVTGTGLAQQDKAMSPSPMIFDRQLLHVRQSHARALGPATFLLDRAATELAERLSAVVRRFELAVDLGTPTDAVRRALAASGKI